MALSITRANVKTELRHVIGDKSDSFGERFLNRAVVTGLERLGRRRQWSFHRTDYPFYTTAPYDSSSNSTTAAISNNGTTVTITGVFPTTSVGAFIEFDGQRQWYEITVRTNDTTATIRNAYPGTALTTASYKILFPAYDLPANFKSLRKVVDLARLSELDILGSDEMEVAHASTSGEGSPTCCAVRAKRNDPNIHQLWLYDAPGSTVESYNVLYNRIPGFYNSSTVATAGFITIPTSITDGSYIDWPDMHFGLLLASCKLSLCEEGHAKGIDYGAVRAEYHERLIDAESNDERVRDPEFLGRPVRRRRREFRIGQP